jgi:hypothetical protein
VGKITGHHHDKAMDIVADKHDHNARKTQSNMFLMGLVANSVKQSQTPSLLLQ